ncbi:hypothetical protein C0991_004046 [Blastosporella zonata]|nr:hypothetical protein C0991_004046 [Blastosporella zonata]
MAALSLMFLVLHSVEETNGFTVDWQETLAKKEDLHPSWISDLADSVVVDFKIPRLGGLIDMTSLKFPELIPFFRRVRMPIILSWGEIDQLPSPPHYFFDVKCVPYPEDIDALHSKESKQELTSLQERVRARRSSVRAPIRPSAPHAPPHSIAPHAPPRPSVSPPPPRPSVSPPPPRPSVPHAPPRPSASQALHSSSAPKPSSVFPPVVCQSGQAPGMTMEDFFILREKRNAIAKQCESNKAREERKRWEEIAERHMLPKARHPGKKGGTMFVWEEVDGHYIRRPVGRQNYQEWWSFFKPTQRRYDSFYRQWDLCDAWDTSEDPVRYDESDDDDDEYWVPSFSPPPAPLEENALVADINLDVDVNDSEDDEKAHLETTTWSNAAYFKYGFNEEYPAKPPVVALDPSVVRKFLGDGKWEAKLSGTPSASMCHFFTYLKASSRIRDIPPSIYDLHQDTSAVNGPRKIVTRLIGQDLDHYVLLPTTGSEPSCVIVIQRAATVVELLRREWPMDFPSMCGNLVDRCIPFRTCIRGPYRAGAMPLSSPPCASLGRRPQNYKPDQVDFAAYETLRDQFLRSPRGRLALLAGGLVARLAHDIVPLREVHQGPLDNVYQDGIFIGKDGTGYYDDVLSAAEINLICGVYRVETGELAVTILIGRLHGGDPQERQISWWPKPVQWEGSGLWQGYWSPDCEKWYQTQVGKIHQGSMSLRNVPGWRKALKLDTPTHHLARHNDQLSAEYLALPPPSSSS